MFVGDRELATAASERCRIFPGDQSMLLRTQQPEIAENSGLRDVKRADFIRNRR